MRERKRGREEEEMAEYSGYNEEPFELEKLIHVGSRSQETTLF